MKKIVFTENQLYDIHNMYENGSSFKLIQEKYGVSQTVLTRVFKEQGWTIKGCHDYRTYTLNENYFDEIDTPTKAYIYGLLAADGYNYVAKGTISLSLQAGDESLLLDINNEIGSNRPLSVRKFTNSNWKDSYTLSIGSMHMSHQLENLGIIQNKSLILDFPEWISETLFPYMLKGYIDGNGWIQKYRIGFMSSDKFAYGVQSFLQFHYGIISSVMDMKRHYNEHTKTWYVCSKKNIHPLVEMMFKVDTICLPRKHQKYIQYGFLNTNNSLVG